MSLDNGCSSVCELLKYMYKYSIVQSKLSYAAATFVATFRRLCELVVLVLRAEVVHPELFRGVLLRQPPRIVVVTLSGSRDPVAGGQSRQSREDTGPRRGGASLPCDDRMQLDPTTGERVSHATKPPLIHGNLLLVRHNVRLLVGVTVARPTTLTLLRGSARNGAHLQPLVAAAQAEKRKHADYDSECAKHGWKMVPFALESLGPKGKEATRLLQQMSAHCRDMSRTAFLAHADRMLSFALQVGDVVRIQQSGERFTFGQRDSKSSFGFFQHADEFIDEDRVEKGREDGPLAHSDLHRERICALTIDDHHTHHVCIHRSDHAPDLSSYAALVQAIPQTHAPDPIVG